MKLRTLTCVLALLGICPAAARAETWFVDKNGSGHFTEIDAAVHAAAPGDVLIVRPGPSYRSFTLSKNLAILGTAGGASSPRVKGRTRVVSVPAFTLAGLEFAGLAIQDVPGSGYVDACTVGVWSYYVDAASKVAFRVVRAGQLLVTRTEVEGYDGDSIGGKGRRALLVIESNTVLVDCDVVGGKGESNISWGDDGADGLQVRQGSHVLLAGCSVVAGGMGGSGPPFSGTSGDAGDAVVAVDSTVVVRGAPGDWVDGPSGFWGGASGRAVVCVWSTVVLSGVSIWGDLVGSGIVLAPRDEPFLEVTGTALPGRAIAVEVYGPPGRTALVGFSLAPALFTLPGTFDPDLALLGNPAQVIVRLPGGNAGERRAARPVRHRFYRAKRIT